MHPTYHNPGINFEETESAQHSMVAKKLLQKTKKLWPWLLASGVLCTAGAYLFLKVSQPQFKIKASILVQDDKKSAGFGEASILQEFGFGSKSNVDNEAEIFKSRTLMEQVVAKENLSTTYAVSGKMSSKEIYSDRPVTVHFLQNREDTLFSPMELELQFDPKKIPQFTLTSDTRQFRGKPGDTLLIPGGKALVTLTEAFKTWNAAEPVLITIHPKDEALKKYSANLSVEIPNKQVSIINLTLNETNKARGEQILESLVGSYMQANVTDKNRIADSTIKFIDDRLRIVFHELSSIEKDIEGFKKTNKLADISVQSKAILENTSEYTKQLTAQEIQRSVADEMIRFLEQNKTNTRIVPSSLIIQDPNFIALAGRYNEVQLQKDKMLMSLTPEHPAIRTANEQLSTIRVELLSSLASIKGGINAGILELKNKTSEFDQQLSAIPTKERAFLDFSRQQAIKQELYLFLLKKREETAVSKSSTIANARIIDKAKSDNLPFKPQKTIVLFLGLLAGLALPLSISFLKDVISKKVHTPEEITDHTKVPVLAEIGHEATRQTQVVPWNSQNPVTEQLRSLRTNLQYLLPGKKQKCILITSSMSGEGKTFLSINICHTLAMAGKKTILLELDLRRPKITSQLGLQKSGFTNYIISEEKSCMGWIQSSGKAENFDILASGPIPPNPAELLMLEKMQVLFEELKERYDYIVIDSPPAGMVTDAEILAAHVDSTLYVVRCGFTLKQHVRLIEKLRQKNTLPHLNLILNDLPVDKMSYGYGYKYGYTSKEANATISRA